MPSSELRHILGGDGRREPIRLSRVKSKQILGHQFHLERSVMDGIRGEQRKIGDSIWELAYAHAAYMNGLDFSVLLRKQSLPLERFVWYISSVYPVVVGFNRALIRSIAKLDNVRNAGIVKGLAVQLQEEQVHKRSR